MTPFVFVLSVSGTWHRHGAARASETQAHNVSRQLARKLGWVTAVGVTPPPVPFHLQPGLPTDDQARCSPVWRDPELKARWEGASVARTPVARTVAAPPPAPREPTSPVAAA